MKICFHHIISDVSSADGVGNSSAERKSFPLNNDDTFMTVKRRMIIRSRPAV
jgi:hypothetical protein